MRTESATWWAALTLVERAEHMDALADGVAYRDHGELRQGLWREGRWVPGVHTDLTELAEAAGVSPDQLIRLLGEPVPALRDRLPAEPDWLGAIRHAYAAASPPVSGAGQCFCGGRGPADRAASPDEALLEWVRPLVDRGVDQLAARLSDVPDLIPPDRAHPLFAPDRAQLLLMTKRVLVLELNIARVRGQLCGDSPYERFDCFARGLRDRATAQGLLGRYPVLARELVRHVVQWVDSRAEFATRFHQDLGLLRARYGIEADCLAAVTDIEFGAGDQHRQGRAVAIVTVGDITLVYKPRSISVDTHVGALVDWVNQRGLRHRLTAALVCERDGYGWSDFAQPQPCDDEAGVRRFHWRAGAYLALLHLIRAYDIHMHNVIAVGEHPVVVDLEAAFHTPTFIEEADDPFGPGVGRAMRESVLAVLLLPQRRITEDDRGLVAVDVSGLAGGAPTDGRTDLHRNVGYTGEGTDRMRAVRKPAPLKVTANRAWLRGTSGPAPIWVDEVVDGFEACYRLLMADREALQAPDGPLAAFAGDHVRVVVRDTRSYTNLLHESWHPDLLRDALDRQCFLEDLRTAGAAGTAAAIVASEHRQLAHQDVPTFYVSTTATALVDPDGPVLPDFTASDGMSAVLARAVTLSEEALRFQSWLVRASLATLDPPERTGPRPRPAASRPDAPLDLDLAVAAATTIADQLIATALHDDSGGAEWLTLNLLGGRYWAIGPTDLGLTAGVTGIALFLAELAALTDRPSYRAVVEDLVLGLLDADQEPEPDDLAGMAVGAHEDLGALAYLLARLTQLWGPTGAPPWPGWLIPALRRNLDRADPHDVSQGLPGAALVLLALREHHRDNASPAAEVDEALRYAGSLLTAAAPRHRPRPGFGNGTAGFAYASARVGVDIDDPRLSRAAVSVVTDGWGKPASDTDGSWCAGLAGDLLGLTAMLSHAGLAPSRVGLDLDLARTMASDAARRLLTGIAQATIAPGNDSLCHGDLGMAEALTRAGVALGDDEPGEVAARLARLVAERALAGDLRGGAPTGVWTPGLLTGAAGVGYGLIQTAAPGRVPSVTLVELEPPSGARSAGGAARW